jgi:hypothetical protein
MSSIGVDDSKTKPTPYTTHLRLLLPVMYVISSLVLVSDVSIVESFVIFYRV